MALADDNHCKTRTYALDTLHSLVCAAKNLDKINADTINNVTRGIVKDKNACELITLIFNVKI